MRTFTVIRGDERFKVADENTGGESFFDEKVDAYKMAGFIVTKLGHAYRIEDRFMNWMSAGGL